jgi:hypothetical protein
MAQTLGVIDIVWNGRKIDVEKGATFKPGGMKNNVVTAGRRLYRAEEFMPGEVKGTTVLQRGQSFKALYTTGEGELQVVCDTGQSFTWPNAFLTELITGTGGEGGKIELTWAVDEGEELLNG